MKIALVISVYNRADFLAKILASIARLTRKPDEIIVAEDGHLKEIASLVKSCEKQLGIPVKHIWQEDKGNRKTLAVNRAIANTACEYLVFIDGDCVLHKDFILEHESLAAEKTFLTGRRIELSERASRHLTCERIDEGYLEKFPIYLYLDAVFGRTHHLGRFFKTPRWARELLGQNEIHDIRGCNLSLWREDFVAVNGYSNDFSGAYGEDSDLEYRLKNYGLRMKSVKGRAIQFHLWHKEQQKDPANQKKLSKVRVSSTYYTSNGLKEVDRNPG
jgi:glycosyltransferase involved in cell wall biosynthesis